MSGSLNLEATADREPWPRLLGLAAIPFAYFLALNFNGASAQLVMLTLATAVAFIFGAALLLGDFRRRRLELPAGWVALFMLAFLLWLLISHFWSTYRYISFLYVWVLGAIPLWCLIWMKAPADRWRWDTLWEFLLIAQMGLLGHGIGEYFAGGMRRGAEGPLIDSNNYGALVNLFFFPLLFTLINLQRRQASAGTVWLYRLLIAVSILALFASNSFGAQLAWGFLLIPTLIMLLRLREPSRLKIGVLALIAVPALLSWGVTQYQRNLSSGWRQHIAATGQTGYQAHLGKIAHDLTDPNQMGYKDRLHMIASSWEIYKNNPWIGTGLNTYKLHYPRYRNPDETSSGGYHAHNDYLEVLEDGGPLLLLCFLLCALAAAQPAWKPGIDALRGRGEPTDDALQKIGLALGVAALYAQASVNFVFYSLPHCVMAGVFIGQLNRGRLPNIVVTLRVHPALPALVLVALLALPMWTLSLAAASAMVTGKQSNLAFVKSIREDSTRHHKFVQAITKLLPSEVLPHVMLGVFNESLAEDWDDKPFLQILHAQKARAHYLRALEASRVSSATYAALAKLLRRYPRLRAGMPEGVSDDPEVLLQHAITLRPSDVDPYLQLADLYLRAGEPEKAYQTLVRAQVWLKTSVMKKPEKLRLLETTLRFAREIAPQDVQRLAKQIKALQPDNKLANEVLAESGNSGGNKKPRD